MLINTIPKEGAVLKLPSILLLSAQSRRVVMVPRGIQKQKAPMNPPELSADRANAARRELVNGGMDETKLLQVIGLSSAVLYDKADPLNPINRRISIIVMNKKAQERIEKNMSIEAGNAESVQKGIQAGAPDAKAAAVKATDTKPDVKPAAKP